MQINNKLSLKIKLYKNDAVISFNDGRIKPSSTGGIKQNISRFTYKSRQNLRLYLNNSIHKFTNLITLTYPSEFVCDGKVSKQHLNSFLQVLRREKTQYLWVMEFQGRGAIHYMILIEKWIDKNLLKRHWYNIVDSGDRKHLNQGLLVESIRDHSKCVSYMCAYMKKIEQKIVPDIIKNCGRFWGCTRGLLQMTGEYLSKTNSYNENRKAIRIVKKYYASKIRQWQQEKKERLESKGLKLNKWFKWRATKYGGFTAWGCSFGISMILMEYGLLKNYGGDRCM